MWYDEELDLFIVPNFYGEFFVYENEALEFREKVRLQIKVWWLEAELEVERKKYSDLLSQTLLEAERSCRKTLALALSGGFKDPILNGVYG